MSIKLYYGFIPLVVTIVTSFICHFVYPSVCFQPQRASTDFELCIYIHISIWNKQHFSHCRSYSITAVYCLNTPHWVGVYLWNTRIRHPNSWDSLDIIWSISISSIARLSQHTNTRHKDHTNQISQRQLSKRLCFECSFVVKCMLSGFILEIRASSWVPFLGNY